MLTDKYYNYMLHLHELIYDDTGDLKDFCIPYHKNYTDIYFLYVLTEYVTDHYWLMLYVHILYMDT